MECTRCGSLFDTSLTPLVRFLERFELVTIPEDVNSCTEFRREESLVLGFQCLGPGAESRSPLSRISSNIGPILHCFLTLI